MENWEILVSADVDKQVREFKQGSFDSPPSGRVRGGLEGELLFFYILGGIVNAGLLMSADDCVLDSKVDASFISKT